MTVDELVGRIETRIKQLGVLSLDMLRLDLSGEDNVSAARAATRGKDRVTLIAEIIVEEFSREYDREIDD